MKIKRFENAERFRVFNRTLQVFLFATACLMAFFLAFKRLPVIDITTEGRYSLTPETIAYLRTLSHPVDIVGSLSLGETGSLGSDRLHELQSLTNRYSEVSDKVKVTWVDAFKAQAEYGFKNPYRILIKSADRSVWITPDDLYIPQEDVFLGERALTSALWQLANPSKRSVVVIASADRLSAEGPWGFKRLEEFFQGRGLSVKSMEIKDLEAIKSLQAEAVFLLGNSEVLGAQGLAIIQRAVNDNRGNVLIAIDEPPSQDLLRFLYFNGIDWPALRVEEMDPRRKTPMGEMIIRDFEDHPITQVLKHNEQTILSRGRWWALTPRDAVIDISVTPIFKSSPQSVAEHGRQKGPFILMAALEKKTDSEISSRILVAGSSDWLANAYLSYKGNQTLLGASLDWLLGNSNLISIPSRSRQVRQLGINSEQLWKMGWGILGCALVLLGMAVVRWMTKPR